MYRLAAGTPLAQELVVSINRRVDIGRSLLDLIRAANSIRLSRFTRRCRAGDQFRSNGRVNSSNRTASNTLVIALYLRTDED